MSHPAAQAYYYLNDHTLEVTGLRDSAGVYLNSATVTASLLDAVTRTEIDGQTWPLTLDYVAASDGDYDAIIEYDLDVIPGQSLVLTVLVDAGAGMQGYWELSVEVQVRKE